MAKKFKIAQNPTFKAQVSIPRVGGDAIEVEFEYKFLPRKSLASLYESWREKASEIDVNEDSKLTELTDYEIALQMSQLKDILVGWNFDDEFNDENIQAVVEMSVHATQAIINSFQEAYSKAKAGN